MNKDLFKDNILEVEESIFEVERLPQGEYDGHAVQYDKLVSNSLYNRIMWGNTPQNYRNFCIQGLKRNNGGIIADIGCGTLSFTYKAYAEYNKKEIFLCDLSNEMLRLGKNRIKGISKDLSSIRFLRSDALNMPFKENAVHTVFCFGIFHIFSNPLQLIKEIARILKPEGQLFITSLCTERKLSARYLNLLYRKGLVAKPLSAVEIKNIIEEGGIKIDTFKVIGGMAYVVGTKNI